MASPTLNTKRQAAREAGTGVRSIGFHMGFTRGEAKERLASGGSLGLMRTRRSWMQWRTPPTKATVSGQTPQPGPLDVSKGCEALCPEVVEDYGFL